MPRNQIIYENTIIYKIVCKDLTVKDSYVGSTTKFAQRKCQHKKSCCNSSKPAYNQKKYEVIRQNGGWENWEMIEIEKFPCKDGEEARSRERYWFETLQSNLNDRLPQRSHEEKVEYNNNYMKDNKATLKEKRAVYMEKIKDDPEYKRKNAERVKAYTEANKEAIRLRQKTNKTTCECGSIYRSRDRYQHIKSNKHLDFISQNNKI